MLRPRFATDGKMDGRKKKALVDQIVRYLNDFPRCVALRRWGMPGVLVAGDPDITGLMRGRHFELSVRDSGEYVNARERERAQRWQEAGAIVATVASIHDVEQVLEKNSIL